MEPEYDSENLKELLYINNPIIYNELYLHLQRNDFNALTKLQNFFVVETKLTYTTQDNTSVIISNYQTYSTIEFIEIGFNSNKPYMNFANNGENLNKVFTGLTLNDNDNVIIQWIGKKGDPIDSITCKIYNFDKLLMEETIGFSKGIENATWNEEFSLLKRYNQNDTELQSIVEYIRISVNYENIPEPEPEPVYKLIHNYLFNNDIINPITNKTTVRNKLTEWGFTSTDWNRFNYNDGGTNYATFDAIRYYQHSTGVGYIQKVLPNYYGLVEIKYGSNSTLAVNGDWGTYIYKDE